MRSEPELLLAAGDDAAAAGVSWGLRLGRLMGVRLVVETPLMVPAHPVTSKPADEGSRLGNHAPAPSGAGHGRPGIVLHEMHQ